MTTYTGDFIAAACVAILVLVVVMGILADWREDKRERERDRLGLGGRPNRRRAPRRSFWGMP